MNREFTDNNYLGIYWEKVQVFASVFRYIDFSFNTV